MELELGQKVKIKGDNEVYYVYDKIDSERYVLMFDNFKIRIENEINIVGSLPYLEREKELNIQKIAEYEAKIKSLKTKNKVLIKRIATIKYNQKGEKEEKEKRQRIKTLQQELEKLIEEVGGDAQ